MKILNHTAGILLMLVILTACDKPKKDLFLQIPKIDAHVHLYTRDNTIPEFAVSRNFHLLSIVTRSDNAKVIRDKFDMALYQHEQYPENVAVITTISMENFEAPNWQQEVIEQLKSDFDAGAIAVKVWKDIGMVFRDSLGNFIMIDDPRFDPVLDFIEQQDKTLLAHLGEPRNCWLPLDSMTVISDRNYFKEHPEYHMYLHPDHPSYEDQIAARDKMLEKHPNLRVVGAHLGSLEWNVDELAKRLEKYPNFAVDMAARICHFQVQDREKVRDFINKYQDRLLYATDFGISGKMDITGRLEWVKNEWHNDWKYFATDSVMTVPALPEPFKGLKLDNEVLRKIYYENAMRWYPGVFR